MHRYLRVYESDGTDVLAEAHEEPRVDAAVSTWIDSGLSRDSVLALDLLDGSVHNTKASNIIGWSISTPDSRRKALEIQKELRDEESEMKMAIGVWDE